MPVSKKSKRLYFRCIRCTGRERRIEKSSAARTPAPLLSTMAPVASSLPDPARDSAVHVAVTDDAVEQDETLAFKFVSLVSRCVAPPCVRSDRTAAAMALTCSSALGAGVRVRF